MQQLVRLNDRNGALQNVESLLQALDKIADRVEAGPASLAVVEDARDCLKDLVLSVLQRLEVLGPKLELLDTMSESPSVEDSWHREQGESEALSFFLFIIGRALLGAAGSVVAVLPLLGEPSTR